MFIFYLIALPLVIAAAILSVIWEVVDFVTFRLLRFLERRY